MVFKYMDELYQLSECVSFIKAPWLGQLSSVLKLIRLIIYKCDCEIRKNLHWSRLWLNIIVFFLRLKSDNNPDWKGIFLGLKQKYIFKNASCFLNIWQIVKACTQLASILTDVRFRFSCTDLPINRLQVSYGQYIQYFVVFKFCTLLYLP